MFFRIPALKIQKITVEGNVLISKEDIVNSVKEGMIGNFMGVLPKENIFLFPREDVLKKMIKDVPRIKTAEIKREFFDGLSIKISERTNAAILCDKEDCAAIDEDGLVFEKTPYISGGAVLKFFDRRGSDSDESPDKLMGKSILPKAQFKKIADFSSLVSKMNGEVVGVILKKENIYELRLREGWNILINSKNEPSPTFANLMTALNFEIKEKHANLAYVDLRFGNKVYFKYKQKMIK